MAFISSDNYTPGIDFKYAQPNLELITNALSTKQIQFDRNYEALAKLKQGYLNLDLFNDEDKNKLNTYNTEIGDWFSNNRSTDFSNSRVIEDITKRFDVFSNDAELKVGVTKTKQFRSIFADIEDSRKKGTFSDISMQNVYDNLEQYKTAKGKDKLNHMPKQYVPKCDYTKNWFENTAKLIADVNYTQQHAGYNGPTGVDVLSINKTLSRERIYNGLYPSANDDCTQSQIREETLFKYNRSPEYKNSLYDNHQKMLKSHYQNAVQSISSIEAQIAHLKTLGDKDNLPLINQLEESLKSVQNTKTAFESRIAQTPEQDEVYRNNFNSRDRNQILSDAAETETHQKLSDFASGVAYQQSLPKYENNPAWSKIIDLQAQSLAGGSGGSNSKKTGSGSSKSGDESTLLNPNELGRAFEPISGDSGIETYHTYNKEIEGATRNNLDAITDVITDIQSMKDMNGNPISVDPVIVAAKEKYLANKDRDPNALNNFRKETRDFVNQYYKDYTEGKIKDPRLQESLETAFETADYERTLLAKKERVINNILKIPEFKGKYKSVDEILTSGGIKVDDIVKKENFIKDVLKIKSFQEMFPLKSPSGRITGVDLSDKNKIEYTKYVAKQIGATIPTDESWNIPFTLGAEEFLPENLIKRLMDRTMVNNNFITSKIVEYNKKYEDGDTKKLAHYFKNPDVATFYTKADDQLKTLANKHFIYNLPVSKDDAVNLDYKNRALLALQSTYNTNIPPEAINILGFTKDNLHIRISIPSKNKKDDPDQEFTLQDPNGKEVKLVSGQSYDKVIKIPIGESFNGVLDLGSLSDGPISRKVALLGQNDIQYFDHSKFVKNDFNGSNYKISVSPKFERGSNQFKYYYYINNQPLEDFFREQEPINKAVYRNYWEEFQAMFHNNLSAYNNPDIVFAGIQGTLKQSKNLKPNK